MGVASYLLKKTYVRGSLRNTGNGFELGLKNTLAPVTIAGLSWRRVDGEEWPCDAMTVTQAGLATPAGAISTESPLTLALGAQVMLQVEDRKLSTGRHAITISILTREVGPVEIPIADDIPDPIAFDRKRRTYASEQDFPS